MVSSDETKREKQDKLIQYALNASPQYCCNNGCHDENGNPTPSSAQSMSQKSVKFTFCGKDECKKHKKKLLRILANREKKLLNENINETIAEKNKEVEELQQKLNHTNAMLEQTKNTIFLRMKGPVLLFKKNLYDNGLAIDDYHEEYLTDVNITNLG